MADVNVDIICEGLSRTGFSCGTPSLPSGMEPSPALSCEVLAREGRRGIRGVRLAGSMGLASDELRDDMLYVASADAMTGLGELSSPRYLLLVLAPGSVLPEVSFNGVAELAQVRTSSCVADVFALVSALMEELEEWDKRMLSAMAHGLGPSGVLDVAAERLANPIGLFDTTLTLMASGGAIPEAASDTIWKDVLDQGYSPLGYYSPQELRLVRDTMERSSWPFVMSPSRTPGQRHLLTRVAVHGVAMGSTGQVDVNAPFTPGQIALTDMANERLCEAFAVSENGAAHDQDELGRLVRALVSGYDMDERLLAHRLSLHGWGRETDLRLLLVSDAAEEPMSRESLRRRLESRLATAVLTSYLGDLIVLCPAQELEEQAGKLGEWLAAVHDRLGAVFTVSEAFRDPRAAHAMYLQCVAIHSVAMSSVGTGLVSLGDVYERLLPRLMEQTVPREALCNPAVLALARDGYRQDVARGRELVRDLYVYLTCGGNVYQAACTLFMHRNTLAYRMTMVERALTVDLGSLESWEVVHYEVSCLIALSLDEGADGRASC